MLTDEQIRENVAIWLKDDLAVLNDEGGKHWTKNAYYSETSSYDEEKGQYIYDPANATRCMMGGLNFVFQTKVTDEVDEDLKILEPDDGTLVDQQDEAGTWLDSVLSYLRFKPDPEKQQRLLELRQVYDATEIALAWASWKLMISPSNKKTRVQHASRVIGAKYVEDEDDDKVRYEMTPHDPHTVVTATNDAPDTKWKDIVKIHEMAIAGISDGSCPLNWEEAGQVLLQEATDKVADYWNPRWGEFTPPSQ